MDDKFLDEVSNLIEEHKFEEAKEMLMQQDIEAEQNVEAVKLLGLCNINLDLYKEAQSNFETVVKYKPEDATSWLYLAMAYDNLDDVLHAVSAYKEVIKLRDKEISAYKCLAVLFIRNKEEEKAIEYIKRALEIDTEDFSLYYIIGTAYMALKKFDECVEYLEKAMAMNPEYSQIYNNLGTAYLTIGKMDKAYENFVKASELEPDNAITYFNIASILQIQNKHEEACEYFEKAYRYDPCDTYLTSLALSEVKLQKWENAIKHYKTLVAHHPEKQTYQYNLACCYEQMGEYKYAISILARLVSLNPKSVSMSRRLADIFLKTNQPMLAKEIYERLILLGNVGFETYYEYAHVCILLKDTDKAEKILKKVIELKPDQANAHKDLGVIYLSKRLLDYAKDEFETALKYEPENDSIISEYANFLHSTSEFKKADEYYEKAIEVNPKAYVTYAFAALNKLFINDYDKALEYINFAIGNSVQNGFFMYIAGKVRFLMKNYEDAKLYLIKSYEMDENIETKSLLAMCYYELENYEQAKNIYSSLLKVNEYNINVLYRLAQCENKLGNKDKALEYLEKTVEISPEFEEAQAMIREIS